MTREKLLAFSEGTKCFVGKKKIKLLFSVGKGVCRGVGGGGGGGDFCHFGPRPDYVG